MDAGQAHGVCSAHAEVILIRGLIFKAGMSLLRTRGGDPDMRSVMAETAKSAPHTRR